MMLKDLDWINYVGVTYATNQVTCQLIVVQRKCKRLKRRHRKLQQRLRRNHPRLRVSPAASKATCPRAVEGNKAAGEAVVERRVDVCTIKPASDQLLTDNGKTYLFCFDSGDECSLIREITAEKFPGRRQHTIVTLLSIGKSSVQSNTQILATVNIQGLSIQLLFHVVPDHCIFHTIVVDRDLLTLGFSVEMSENQLILKKTKIIAVCDVGSKVNDFRSIDTDVPCDLRNQLLTLLEENAEYFVEGTWDSNR